MRYSFSRVEREVSEVSAILIGMLAAFVSVAIVIGVRWYDAGRSSTDLTQSLFMPAQEASAIFRHDATMEELHSETTQHAAGGHSPPTTRASGRIVPNSGAQLVTYP